MVTRKELLQHLPPYRDEWVVVHSNQSVKNIITELLNAHREFAGYYDMIAPLFDADTTEKICKNLYTFCKKNIEYKEESEDRQTTAIPAGILTRGYGDCKHYASFCGGVLDAIGRMKGEPIDFYYCFASYNPDQPDPYHVFIVVNDNGQQIWIDPTPGAEDKTPVWVVNKKISGMPLLRNIAGISDTEINVPDTSIDIPQELIGPISILQNYGVLSPLGEFNAARLDFVTAILPDNEAQNIRDAVAAIVQRGGAATVGNWFDDAFKGIQHFAAGMGMQVPRASFLGLVRINAFGYANKLKRALSYPDSKAALADKWERLGGVFSVLENTINAGATQPTATQIQQTADPVGTYRGSDGKLYFVANNQLVPGVAGIGAAIGIVPVVAAAAISSAAIIVAAIMPLITKLLANHGTVANDIPLNPQTGLPANYGGGTGILSFLQNNPLALLAILAIAGYAYYEYKNG